MKTLIVGMGLVGVMHGWALAFGGVSVTHKVRPGRAAAYNGGLVLDVLDRRGGGEEKHYTAHYAPPLIEEVTPADGFELVMVPTRENQAAEAVAQLKDACPDAQFLLFTANWDGPGAIDALLPRERYLWGYSACAGGYDGATVVANLAAVVRLGEWQGEHTDRLQAVIDLFGRGGFGPDLKPDIIQWLWVHQGINSGMIGAALVAGGLRRMAEDRARLVFMARAVRESLAVVAARGVDLGAYPDVEPFLNQPAEAVAEVYYQQLNQTDWGRRTVDTGHFNHNRAEMRRFFDQVYRTAKELGLDTPLMDQINQGLGAD